MKSILSGKGCTFTSTRHARCSRMAQNQVQDEDSWSVVHALRKRITALASVDPTMIHVVGTACGLKECQMGVGEGNRHCASTVFEIISVVHRLLDFALLCNWCSSHHFFMHGWPLVKYRKLLQALRRDVESNLSHGVHEEMTSTLLKQLLPFGFTSLSFLYCFLYRTVIVATLS